MSINNNFPLLIQSPYSQSILLHLPPPGFSRTLTLVGTVNNFTLSLVFLSPFSLWLQDTLMLLSVKSLLWPAARSGIPQQGGGAVLESEWEAEWEKLPCCQPWLCDDDQLCSGEENHVLYSLWASKMSGLNGFRGGSEPGYERQEKRHKNSLQAC